MKTLILGALVATNLYAVELTPAQKEEVQREAQRMIRVIEEDNWYGMVLQKYAVVGVRYPLAVVKFKYGPDVFTPFRSCSFVYDFRVRKTDLRTLSCQR